MIVESQDWDSLRSLEPADRGHILENIPVGQTRILINTTAEDHETTGTYTLSVTRPPSCNATLRSLDPSVGSLQFSQDITEYSVELANEVNDVSFTFATAHIGATTEAILERPDAVSTETIQQRDGRFEITDLPEGRSVLSIAVTAEDGKSTRYTRLNSDAELLRVLTS